MGETAFRLKVTPDELDKQASLVEQAIKNIKMDFDKITKRIEGSKSYWIGDASKRHQDCLTENQEDMELILKRLNEHPTDLRKMAGIYRTTEETNEELATALPDDIIF